MSQEEIISHVMDSNFEQEVLKSGKPVLVDFWAPWCGPCKAIAPLLEELAVMYKDQLSVVKINVDDSPNTASTYGVMGIPTLILFKGGNIVDKIIGLAPKDRIDALIKQGL